MASIDVAAGRAVEIIEPTGFFSLPSPRSKNAFPETLLGIAVGDALDPQSIVGVQHFVEIRRVPVDLPFAQISVEGICDTVEELVGRHGIVLPIHDW